MKSVEVFTDGACKGNPGPGGWGALLRFQGKEREIYGAEPETTNNRMELLAAIEGLRALREPCKVALTTDSVYVKNGITQWLPNWKKRGWKTASKQPVKNEDLWRALDELRQTHDIEFHWVKGHADHPENTLVDQLAVEARDRAAAGR